MMTNHSGQAGAKAARALSARTRKVRSALRTARFGFRNARSGLRAGRFGLLPILAFVGILAACTSNYTRPLVARGLPPDERKDYIIQNGFGIPENIKQAFLEGYVEVGMAREMVFQLYGSPDRTTGGDTNWEYVNNKGNLITGITFKADKVEKLYGDPRGGSGEPHAAT